MMPVQKVLRIAPKAVESQSKVCSARKCSKSMVCGGMKTVSMLDLLFT